MKKFLTGVRGKQFLVLGLVFLVVVAGYYRWTVDKNSSTLAVMNDKVTIEENIEKIANEEDSAGTDDYFARARYERDMARSEAAELLKVSAVDTEDGIELAAKNREMLEKSAKNMESETAIENMVIAKGYSDCVAFVDDTGVRVIVKSDSLEASGVAQIKDIVVEKTGFKATEIKISTKK